MTITLNRSARRLLINNVVDAQMGSANDRTFETLVSQGILEYYTETRGRNHYKLTKKGMELMLQGDGQWPA